MKLLASVSHLLFGLQRLAELAYDVGQIFLLRYALFVSNQALWKGVIRIEIPTFRAMKILLRFPIQEDPLSFALAETERQTFVSALLLYLL